MKNKNDEIIVDENGEHWRFLREVPCPEKLEPIKHNLKIRFEVEFNLQVEMKKKPHTHLIREKESENNQSDTTELEKWMAGYLKDFGIQDCFNFQIATRPNVTITNQKIEQTSNLLSNNSDSMIAFYFEELFNLFDMEFNETSEYIKDHFENGTKEVFESLCKEIELSQQPDRELTISKIKERYTTALRKRVIKPKKRPSLDEKKKFIEKCCNAIKELKSEKEKVNIKNIASNLYSRELDSARKFSRERKKFYLTSKEILEMDKNST